MLAKKKIGSLKKTLKKYFIIGSQHGGFQFMLILDLWGISFHPVVAIGLGNKLLFNFMLGHCGKSLALAVTYTGGPPLTQFSLPRIPLTQFFATLHFALVFPTCANFA